MFGIIKAVLKKVTGKKIVDAAAVGGVVGGATFVSTGMAESEDPVLTAALALAAALIRFIFLLRKGDPAG